MSDKTYVCDHCEVWADEVTRLRQALEDIAMPMGMLKRQAAERGVKLSGYAFWLSQDVNLLQKLARNALAAPCPHCGVMDTCERCDRGPQ